MKIPVILAFSAGLLLGKVPQLLLNHFEKPATKREQALRKSFNEFIPWCDPKLITWNLTLEGRDEIMTIRCTIDYDPDASRILREYK